MDSQRRRGEGEGGGRVGGGNMHLGAGDHGQEGDRGGLTPLCQGRHKCRNLGEGPGESGWTRFEGDFINTEFDFWGGP